MEIESPRKNGASATLRVAALLEGDEPMPSQLIGLMRTLAWSDFGTPKPGQAPAAGQVMEAANTEADCAVTNISVQPIPNTHPPQYRLQDSLIVTISFNKSKSYVYQWVFNQSQQAQDDLLTHEQGHYNITALVARDYFIDVMQLKSQQFTTAQNGLNAVKNVSTGSLDLIQKIDDLYDADTSNGQNAKGQTEWNGYFQTAFTQARTSGERSPDGIPYKVRLIDLLRTAGKQI
jgi:hypothetical protein